MSGEEEGGRIEKQLLATCLLLLFTSHTHLISKSKLSIVSKIPVTLQCATFWDTERPLACLRKFVSGHGFANSPKKFEDASSLLGEIFSCSCQNLRSLCCLVGVQHNSVCGKQP